MGITQNRFYLYASPDHCTPWILARVVRPAAPGYAVPAVEFASQFAQAKADALVRAILGSQPPAPRGHFTPLLDEDTPEDGPLRALHGCKLDLWWTHDSKRHKDLAIGPGTKESDFWAWLDEFMFDKSLNRLKRPAEQIRVHLVTEADTRMLDRPLLMIDDVDWLTREEFDHLHRRGGLEELLRDKLACTPKVNAEAWNQVKVNLVLRALADDEANGDLRAASFRSIVLAGYAPGRALQLAVKIASEVSDEHDVRAIAYALASTLHRLQGHKDAQILVSQWRLSDRDFSQRIVSELETLQADDDD